MKVPKFKTLQEERAFWDSHSITDYLAELKQTKEIVFQRPPLKRNFQLRLDDDTLKKLRTLAGKKGTDVSAIIRSWIRNHLEKELKSAS